MDLTEFWLKEARAVRCQLGAGEVDEEHYQIWRVIRYWGWGTLAKLTMQRQKRKLKIRAKVRRQFRGHSRIWSRRDSLSVDGVRTKPETRWPGSGLGLALLSAGVAMQTTILSPVFRDLQTNLRFNVSVEGLIELIKAVILTANHLLQWKDTS